jgi:general secretion pathway protein I
LSNTPQSNFHYIKSPEEDGFSLIEVLVALTILGFVLAAIFQVFSGGLQNVTAADHYVRAAIIADSKLAAVGYEIPLEPGKASHGQDGEYAWAVAITPYNIMENTDSTETTTTPLYKIAISVRWKHVLSDRRMTIDTLMIGGAP